MNKKILLSFILIIVFLFTINLYTNSLLYDSKNILLDKEIKNKQVNFEIKDFQNYQLIAYKIDALNYKIFLNDTLIGQVTKQEKVIGNMASKANIYDIPKNILKENNQIRIEFGKFYDNTKLNHPLIITNNNQAVKIKNAVFFFQNLPFYILLSTIILFLLFYLLFVIFNKKLDSYNKYYIIAIFIFGLQFIELFNPTILNISMLVYKKIFVISIWGFLLFLGIALYKEFKFKIIKILNIINFISLIIIILPNNLDAFSLIYEKLIIFLFISNLVIWMSIIIKGDFRNLRVKLFKYSLTLLIFCNLYDLYMFTKNKSYISFGIYSFIFFIFILIFLILIDYINKMNELIQKEKYANEMYQKAIKDDLTGCFTYEYLKDKVNEDKLPYNLVIIDLDNFKKINDTLGHQVGDQILTKFVSITKKYLKSDEILARYGGDEFIIASKNNDIDSRIKKISEIYNSLNIYDTSIDFSISVGISKFNEYIPIEKGFKITDSKLLKAKREGKSKIIK